jgi:hypothetical protein
MTVTKQHEGPPAGSGETSPRAPRGIRFDRRTFLKSSLSTVGAYAVALGGTTWLVGPGKAWAVEMIAFEPELTESLVAMTRALYPHERLGDIYYAVVVKELDAEASGFEDKERLDLYREGMLALDEAAGGSFLSAPPEEQEKALEAISASNPDFFQAVRSKTVVSLYGQPDVWAQFGYEGPSYEMGGYLFNGFNDLSWLPDPPAEASPPVQL